MADMSEGGAQDGGRDDAGVPQDGPRRDDGERLRAGGTNTRPLHEPIGSSAPGLPDDALGPGEVEPDANVVNAPGVDALARRMTEEARAWRKRHAGEGEGGDAEAT